jgi:hypothetical protein
MNFVCSKCSNKVSDGKIIEGLLYCKYCEPNKSVKPTLHPCENCGNLVVDGNISQSHVFCDCCYEDSQVGCLDVLGDTFDDLPTQIIQDIMTAEFEGECDSVNDIVMRMRENWVVVCNGI